MNNTQAHKDVIADMRKRLKDVFMQCTTQQQEFFTKRLYPNRTPETLEEDKLEWAIQQCYNTIENNKKKEGVVI